METYPAALLMLTVAVNSVVESFVWSPSIRSNSHLHYTNKNWFLNSHQPQRGIGQNTFKSNSNVKHSVVIGNTANVESHIGVQNNGAKPNGNGKTSFAYNVPGNAMSAPTFKAANKIQPKTVNLLLGTIFNTFGNKERTSFSKPGGTVNLNNIKSTGESVIHKAPTRPSISRLKSPIVLTNQQIVPSKFSPFSRRNLDLSKALSSASTFPKSLKMNFVHQPEIKAALEIPAALREKSNNPRYRYNRLLLDKHYQDGGFSMANSLKKTNELNSIQSANFWKNNQNSPHLHRLQKLKSYTGAINPFRAASPRRTSISKPTGPTTNHVKQTFVFTKTANIMSPVKTQHNSPGSNTNHSTSPSDSILHQQPISGINHNDFMSKMTNFFQAYIRNISNKNVVANHGKTQQLQKMTPDSQSIINRNTQRVDVQLNQHKQTQGAQMKTRQTSTNRNQTPPPQILLTIVTRQSPKPTGKGYHVNGVTPASQINVAVVNQGNSNANAIISQQGNTGNINSVQSHGSQGTFSGQILPNQHSNNAGGHQQSNPYVNNARGHQQDRSSVNAMSVNNQPKASGMHTNNVVVNQNSLSRGLFRSNPSGSMHDIETQGNSNINMAIVNHPNQVNSITHSPVRITISPSAAHANTAIVNLASRSGVNTGVVNQFGNGMNSANVAIVDQSSNLPVSSRHSSPGTQRGSHFSSSHTQQTPTELPANSNFVINQGLNNAGKTQHTEQSTNLHQNNNHINSNFKQHQHTTRGQHPQSSSNGQQQQKQTIQGQNSQVPVQRHHSQAPAQEQKYQAHVLQNRYQSTMETQPQHTIQEQHFQAPVKGQQPQYSVQGHNLVAPVKGHYIQATIQGQQPMHIIQGHQSHAPLQGHNSNAPVQIQDSQAPVQGQQPQYIIQGQHSMPPVQIHHSNAPVQVQDSQAPAQGQQTQHIIQGQHSMPPVQKHHSNAPVQIHDSQAPAQGQQPRHIIQGKHSMPPILGHHSNAPVQIQDSQAPVQGHHPYSPIQKQLQHTIQGHHSQVPVQRQHPHHLIQGQHPQSSSSGPQPQQTFQGQRSQPTSHFHNSQNAQMTTHPQYTSHGQHSQKPSNGHQPQVTSNQQHIQQPVIRHQSQTTSNQQHIKQSSTGHHSQPMSNGLFQSSNRHHSYTAPQGQFSLSSQHVQSLQTQHHTPTSNVQPLVPTENGQHSYDVSHRHVQPQSSLGQNLQPNSRGKPFHLSQRKQFPQSTSHLQHSQSSSLRHNSYPTSPSPQVFHPQSSSRHSSSHGQHSQPISPQEISRGHHPQSRGHVQQPQSTQQHHFQPTPQAKFSQSASHLETPSPAPYTQPPLPQITQTMINTKQPQAILQGHHNQQVTQGQRFRYTPNSQNSQQGAQGQQIRHSSSHSQSSSHGQPQQPVLHGQHVQQSAPGQHSLTITSGQQISYGHASNTMAHGQEPHVAKITITQPLVNGNNHNQQQSKITLPQNSSDLLSGLNLERLLGNTVFIVNQLFDPTLKQNTNTPQQSVQTGHHGSTSPPNSNHNSQTLFDPTLKENTNNPQQSVQTGHHGSTSPPNHNPQAPSTHIGPLLNRGHELQRNSLNAMKSVRTQPTTISITSNIPHENFSTLTPMHSTSPPIRTSIQPNMNQQTSSQGTQTTVISSPQTPIVTRSSWIMPIANGTFHNRGWKVILDGTVTKNVSPQSNGHGPSTQSYKVLGLLGPGISQNGSSSATPQSVIRETHSNGLSEIFDRPLNRYLHPIDSSSRFGSIPKYVQIVGGARNSHSIIPSGNSRQNMPV